MFVKSTHSLYPPSWCCLHAHLLSLFHVSNSLKKHLIQCLAVDCKFSCWCDGNCVNLTIVIAFKYTGCILSQDKSMAVHGRGWSWASLWCLSSTAMHLWCKLLLLGKTRKSCLSSRSFSSGWLQLSLIDDSVSYCSRIGFEHSFVCSLGGFLVGFISEGRNKHVWKFFC